VGANLGEPTRRFIRTWRRRGVVSALRALVIHDGGLVSARAAFPSGEVGPWEVVISGVPAVGVAVVAHALTFAKLAERILPSPGMPHQQDVLVARTTLEWRGAV
jgi:hypothetical protein